MNESLETFMTCVNQFVSALRAMHPECIKTNKLSMQLKVGCGDLCMDEQKKLDNKKMLITKYHNTMMPYYNQCMEGDASIFDDESIKSVLDLDLTTKINSYDDEEKEIIWEYINSCNNYAKLFSVYSLIPDSMAAEVGGMAQKIVSDLQSGQNLNPMSLLEMGKDIASKMSQDDLENFSSSMSQNMDQLKTMMPQMGGSNSNENQLASMTGTLMNLLPKNSNPNSTK